MHPSGLESQFSEREKDSGMMPFTTLFLVSSILALLTASPATAQGVAVPSPAPAPAPHHVNLTDLLSVAGPFHTFLNYLIETKVIDTFQNQANNTMQGITIFVPKDSAFSSLKKPSLTNLTQDQLKSVLLFHAFPKYYSLSDFKNLSDMNPVSTFAGGQYSLNITDASGLVRVDSSWSDPKISSSVYSTDPVAVYEIDRVLLPVAIFGTAPPPAPALAPAPDTTPVSDLAPSSNRAGASPASSESSNNDSSSYNISVSIVTYLALVVSGGLMLLF